MHDLNHPPKKVVLKLYSNQILWKGHFPCQDWELWLLFIFSIWLGQINYILIYFCNFYYCKSWTLFAYVQQPFIFLILWILVHVLCTCLEYQPFVHFIFQVLFSSLLFVCWVLYASQIYHGFCIASPIYHDFSVKNLFNYFLIIASFFYV